MANLQVFMHVPYEALGSMEGFFLRHGFQISYTKFYLGEAPPSMEEVDFLVVMGGPMSVHDVREYPWLSEEKAFIRNYIKTGKKALGICLGAQLLSEALGGEVTNGSQKEIGWFPLKVHEKAPATETPFSGVLPLEGPVFHWHGETFSIPENCVPLLSSEACLNQAFCWKDRVLALQFHLETTSLLAQNLIEHSTEAWGEEAGVQSQKEILAMEEDFKRLNAQMEELLAPLIK